MSNFEEALERLHLVGFEYAGGMPNDGPMAVEALESLGHQALIPAFVNIYVPRLPVFEAGRPLGDAEVEGAYGDFSHASNWVATFEERLEAKDWRRVLEAETPRLLPGLFAGTWHGLLRTSHAIRSLEREDSPLRRRELARGLAYWAARFQLVPGSVGRRARAEGVSVASESSVSLSVALANWPLYENGQARIGLLSSQARFVQTLSGSADFIRSLERVELPAAEEVKGVEDFLDRLCVHAAELYVANPHSRAPLVHALTIPHAVRTLIPFLATEDAPRAAGYALQAVGAFRTLFGNREAAPEQDDEVLRVAEDWDEIRYHAACSIQEHSIEMVEACWHEDQRRPHPAFRRAAADAALKIDGRT